MAELHLAKNEKGEMDFRLDGLAYTVNEGVPTLVGTLVLHLARKGVLDLGEFERDLQGDFDPDPRKDDSTGALIATLASLVACYRRDGNDGEVTDTARYGPVYEMIG